MKHWHLDDVTWQSFDPSRVDKTVVKLVKAAAMVERNGGDYGIYLNNVFRDDPDFRAAVDRWSIEEIQHGDALGAWAMLADPTWDFHAAFARYKAGYQVPMHVENSVRGSRTGELVARCMVETGTSSYYTALADATAEPVLQQICRLIAADEYRHFKLFYDHMRRYLRRENIGVMQRLRIAAGRITESEDDELAFAYHCGNMPSLAAYDHEGCTAAYMGSAMTFYRYNHIARGTGMILKSIGLPARGRFSELAARLAWKLLQRRRDQFARQIEPMKQAA